MGGGRLAEEKDGEEGGEQGEGGAVELALAVLAPDLCARVLGHEVGPPAMNERVGE